MINKGVMNNNFQHIKAGFEQNVSCQYCQVFFTIFNTEQLNRRGRQMSQHKSKCKFTSGAAYTF